MIIICPSCNREITVVDTDLNNYCTFCGARIPKVNLDKLGHESAKRLRDNIIFLFRCGDYSKVEDYSDKLLRLDPDNFEILAFKYATDIIQIQRKYIDSAIEVMNKLTGKAFKHVVGKYLFGADDYDKDPIHPEYLNAVKHKIHELRMCLDRFEESKDDSLDLVIETLSNVLLGITPEAPYYTRIILEADDIFFEELIPNLSDEQLIKHMGTYGNSHNRKRALPNQMKLILKMEEEMDKRGIDTIKRSKRSRIISGQQ